MYNNFSSKKTKKVISALLATALVATSAPISADAATTKTVGVGKTITYNAKATVKKVTVKNKKIVTAKKSGKKVTIKGKSAGKTTVTVKTTKKTVKLTVKVGATAIAKKSVTTSMKVGETKALKVTATNGKGDTIKFTSSDKATLKVNKASAKANSKKVAGTTVTALKAGKAKITATSKYTGKKKTFTITVVDATPTVTPSTNPAVVATTPAVTNTTTPGTNPGGSTSTTTKAPTATSGAATNAPGTSANPDETKDPNATGTPGESNAPSSTDVANTEAPTTTDAVETVAPDTTEAPDVTTTPAITTTPSAVEFTAKQIGEKKIEVTNPTAFTKADVVVKRGNSAVTIESVEFDKDATTAIVTLAGSIVDVEYVVSVGDTSKTIKGEVSVPADIQITSTAAPVLGQIGGTDPGYSDTAVANYVVYNQFKEDITSKTSLTANTSAKSIVLDPAKGTMTITWASDPRLNDVVSVVLMYQNTGLSTTKLLTVATKSAPAEVEVYGVYNADGKKLSATNIDNESFQYLFRVKDQYGNYMTTGIDTTSASANLFVNTAVGMTNVDLVKGSNPTIVSVDGVNYWGYQIDKVNAANAAVDGEITVMLIPGGSGKTVTDKITISKGSSVTSLNINVTGTVPSQGTIDLDYIALDENGDEVKSYRVLKEVTSSDTDFAWVKEDGVVKLRYDDSTKNANQGTAPGSSVTTVFQLPNYETVLVTVNVTDVAVPASIASVSDDVSLATRINAFGATSNVVKIPVDKLNFQDQYGNTVAADDITWADLGSTVNSGDFAVMVVAEDANNAVFNGVPDGSVGDYYSDGSTLTTSDVPVYAKNGSSYDDIVLTANAAQSATTTGQTGTEAFTFKLVQFDGTNWVDYTDQYYTGAKVNYTQTGSFTSILTATEDKRFVSYKVNDIDTIYDDVNAGDGYARAVEVKGVLSNGQTVDLTEGTDFKVVPGADGNLTVDTDDKTLLTAESGGTSAVNYAPNATTAKASYSVVINYNGQTINKEVTICNDAPKITSVEFSDSSKKGINVTGGNAGLTLTNLNTPLKVKDNYGEEATVIPASGAVACKHAASTGQIKYTVSDIDSVNGSVTNNGESNITFSNFAAGDSFTITFTVGEASFSTVVSVKA